jgi:hypothetical protein
MSLNTTLLASVSPEELVIGVAAILVIGLISGLIGYMTFDYFRWNNKRQAFDLARGQVRRGLENAGLLASASSPFLEIYTPRVEHPQPLLDLMAEYDETMEAVESLTWWFGFGGYSKLVHARDKMVAGCELLEKEGFLSSRADANRWSSQG